MRVALVHELLTMKGGAERVLQIFADMFPDAPIYTLLHDETIANELLPGRHIVRSALQKYAAISKNHHLYLPFFPRAAEAWDFSAFDLVISSSSACTHGIITNGNPKHLSFVNSPARYLWDRFHDVSAHTSNPIARGYLSCVAHRLRIWDSEAAMRPDAYICSSKEVQRRIQLYWNRESEVVYPPIDEMWFNTGLQTHNTSLITHNYFLIVSTLARYKNIDLAIEACNKLKLPLVIVGTGADEARLKTLAGPTVTFFGHVPTADLPGLYAGATATIFPGYEDFGLVPLESFACGTPVIAYRGGGALETVIEGETGTFFDAQTSDSLMKTLQYVTLGLTNSDHKKYSKEKCQLQAQKFNRSTFEQKIYAKIDALMATRP